jgi:hypothetical protein
MNRRIMLLGYIITSTMNRIARVGTALRLVGSMQVPQLAQRGYAVAVWHGDRETNVSEVRKSAAPVLSDEFVYPSFLDP